MDIVKELKKVDFSSLGYKTIIIDEAQFAVKKTNDKLVRILSEGYGYYEVDLNNWGSRNKNRR